MEPIRRTTVFQRERMVNNLATVKAEIAKTQMEATTGQSVSLPEDAPELWVALSRLRSETNDQEVYAQNSKRALAVLNATENAMTQAGNLIKRAKELAIQGANTPLDSRARDNMAAEVESIRGNILSLANSQIDGRYVFAGTKYDQAAFTSTATYQGDTGLPDAQVGRSARVAIGFDGSDVFQGSVDTFQALADLATALRNDDAAGIQSGLSNLDTAFEQNVTWLQEAGNRSRSVTDAGDLAEQMTTVTASTLEKLVGVDQATALQRLVNLRQTYESTLAVAAATGRDNLFSRL